MKSEYKNEKETSQFNPETLCSKITLKWYQTLGPWYKEDRFTFQIRKHLVSNRIIFKFLCRMTEILQTQFIELRRHLDKHKKSLRLLEEQPDEGYNLNSEFGYAGDVFLNEFTTAHKYKKQIDENFKKPSESKVLYQHIIESSSALLKQENIKYYLNFGVSYAHTDSVLAMKFPSVNFIGIERTDAAKIYNERFFSQIKNLKIISGDIFKIFKDQRFDDSVFVHSRTLLLLPQKFVRTIYSAAFDAGFKYILGTEQYGISRQTNRSYKFSFRPQKSVVYRDFMYIHNYPNLLLEAGFELQKLQAIKTDHPHEDCRILSFLARSKVSKTLTNPKQEAA